MPGESSVFFNAQSGIGGELSVMAARTEKPGARKLDIAHRGQHIPRAHLAITGCLAAGTGHLQLVNAGRFIARQLA